MAVNVQIDKLSKDNYDAWKLSMEAILIKNELWSYVNGEKIYPPEDTAGRAVWKKCDDKARADIILAVTSSELNHMKGCKTACEMWTKLKDIHQSKLPARKATYLKQLLFMRMQSGESMHEHLNNYSNVLDKLTEMDLKILFYHLVSILLLYSIPSSYENFRCAIESRDELPNPESLIVKMLDEFNARQTHTSGTNVENALNIHKVHYSRFRTNKNRDNDKKDNFDRNNYKQNHACKPYKCNDCNKMGHKVSDCWSKSKKRQVLNTEKEAFITQFF